MHHFRYQVEQIINNRMRTHTYGFYADTQAKADQLCKTFLLENYGKDHWYRIKKVTQLN